jgi:DinB superfamily
VVNGVGETKYPARMKNFIRLTTIAALLSLSLPVAAQTRDGVMGELLKDVGDLEKKVMALANAIPESAYAWTPGPGVRSTGEVFKHIAADNYFMPVLLDKPAPKETGITKDYKTTLAFEKRPMNRAALVAELEKSFAFLRTSMNSTPDVQLNAPLDVFGQKSTAADSGSRRPPISTSISGS